MTHDEKSRELYEKEKPKEPNKSTYFYGTNYFCPVCNHYLEQRFGKYSENKYCYNCGQKIDWSFLDEGG